MASCMLYFKLIEGFMLLLPQQSAQQKSESDSFAILVYKLKELGIFRNVTANDFGIDFEIELVQQGSVSGRLMKAQVKSRQSLKIDGNGQVAVGGIAQSTLAYWLSVSKHCPVIVFAVDLKTETIFHSEPIYQQAASLLDGTPAEKTVKLSYNICNSGAGLERLRAFALDYGFEAKRLMHQDALLQLDYLVRSMNKWANYNLDKETELRESEKFPWLLRTCRALLGYEPLIVHCAKYGLDFNRFYDIAYWVERSEQLSGIKDALLRYQGTRKHIPFLICRLLQYLQQRRDAMLGAEAFYWLHEDRQYLNMVFEFKGFHANKNSDWRPSYYRQPYLDFVALEERKLEKRLKDYEEAASQRKAKRSDKNTTE